MYLIICLFLILLLSGLLVWVISCTKGKDERIKKNIKERPMLSHLDAVKVIDRAFSQNNFKVFYQPIFSVKKKRIVACEALLRIQDPELGLITPNDFIPTAESIGNIFDIGELVLEEVCRFLSNDEIRRLDLEYVNVNLSLSESKDEKLPDRISDILNRYEVEPSKIRLEIKEDALDDDPERLRVILDRLNDMGVGLSLDDYGTGHSTFSNVMTFPFCAVKFDRTMLWSAMASTKVLYAMCASINMLKDLDMNIVVEGAESEEMVERLKELKCDYLQGFYFARPMNQTSFVEFMSNC